MFMKLFMLPYYYCICLDVYELISFLSVDCIFFFHYPKAKCTSKHENKCTIYEKGATILKEAFYTQTTEVNQNILCIEF